MAHPLSAGLVTRSELFRRLFRACSSAVDIVEHLEEKGLYSKSSIIVALM